jgi:hypothetical protein
MTLNRSFVCVIVLAMALIPASVLAQCPYSQPTFSKNQVKQLCLERNKQQDALAKQFAKVRVDMITAEAKSHDLHVGNIYAVLVGGALNNEPSSGGSLVPIIPSLGPRTLDQFVSIGPPDRVCRVTLHFNSAQDYSIFNDCSFPVKVVAIFSSDPVVPLKGILGSTGN